MIDKRIIRVGIELDGVVKYFEDVNIKCTGSKTNNSTQNEFNISISNLNRETRNYILTNNNILNRKLKNKRVTVEAGRVSTGVSMIFTGDIRMVTVSQPPDLTLDIKVYTGDAEKSKLTSVSSGATSSLSQICQTVANGLNKKLIFQATDRNISNFTFTGGNLELVKRIEDLGGIDVTIDDDNMIVKTENTPLTGLIAVVNKDTGMIGLPAVTETGITVKMLFDNNIKIGTKIQVESEINPAINGNYVIFKIGYELTNRDTPFYLNCETTRL